MELRRDEGSQSELASVRIYAPSSERKIFVISVFVALYAIAVSYCIGTSGDAHEDALERIRKRNRENFAPNKTDTKELLPDDPLPTEWAPASWAGILMGTVVTLHILFHLMCYWRPAFHAWSLHSVARKVRHGCRALATPLEYRGSAAMVEVKMSDLTDLCGFEFQRLRYEVVVAPREGDDDTQLDDDEPDMVKRVACPTEKQLKHYASKRGHDFDDVELLEEQFGKNMLTVPIPSFAVLYREQILSPLVIFQLFLSILWAMDDYLSYTLMQFCFILMFESTTVFQRQRTMKMLNGMTVKPFDVKVYRNREWLQVTTSDLLPGDLMQLTADRPGAQAPSSEVVPSQGSEATGAQPTPAKPPDANAGVAVVPCDCLLLRGEVVVNEASLTGESVPQMKEALLLEDLERALDAEGEDMIHVLASGTSPMSTKPGEVVKTGLAVGLPETPDGGCLCYVLRTGFSSSQGKLLQMIEFSTDRKAVKADEKEMTYALLVLLCFALLASGYVFKKGMEKGDKTPYELLLKCVIIISSVVPRSLPMTMAVAVNTALMTLLRAGVFCTEPHRVPFAGKLTNCLFDKTGTITTDTLSLEGIVNSGDGKTAKGDEAAVVIRIPGCEFGLEPVKSASAAASLVLGACHSLVSVEGKGLMGDPIEISGLRAAGWTYDADKAVASPCEAEAAITAVAAAKNEVAKMEERLKTFSAIRAITEAENKEKADKEALLQKAEAALKIMEKKDKEHPVEGVHILQRYRFLSKLQRSCTVVKLKAREGKKTAGSLNTGRYVLVKGSPEMVGELLAKGAAPDWYHNRYRDLAENGYRVIALAYKPISDGADDDVPNRDEAERDLQFVGFIAFSCRVRTDSELVITALRESAHSIALITGDSPLTALHVARQTGFCKKEATALVLQVDDSTSDVSWAVAAGKQRGELRPFTAAGMKDLVEKDGLDLMVTEAAMRIAVEKDPDLWNQLENIRVFARMTPQGKTDVIRSLQKMERKVLMCGDGGNDMGALKQADVGLALMSGYGNMNADAEGEKKEAIEEENGESTAIVPVEQTLVKGAEDALNQQQKDLEKRSKAMQRKNRD